MSGDYSLTYESLSKGYLPLVLRLNGLPCLVVGGGRVGTRKALRLSAVGAAVAVVSPDVTAELNEAINQGRVVWHRGVFEPRQLAGMRLVVAATSDADLNIAIGREADTQGIWACVTSSAKDCRVFFPAVWSDGQVAVAVHSHGSNCQRAQAVRDAIADWLVTEDAESAGAEPVGPFGLDRPSSGEENELLRPSRNALGTVFIIGAGPGAADLITLRGVLALQAADAILADRLVPRSFLFELGISERGKIVKHLGDQSPRWSQEEINRWLVEMAEAGKTVARLKGGDPFVFGRGDSEIQSLARRGIAWEVIPGPTSATAVLTAAGFPLTRHAEGRSFAVTTARIEGGRVTNALPKADTLVILMGIAALPQIVDRLQHDCWAADAPAAIVERGTLTGERRAIGTLQNLCALAEQGGFSAPAIVVVGEAARSIAVIQQQPTILFTGLDPTAFRTLGNVLHWPAQEIAPHPQAETRLEMAFTALVRNSFDWVAFTDKQAVIAVLAAMAARGRDARCFGQAKIAALSPATGAQLVRGQIQPDATFADMDNEFIARQLVSRGDRSKILLVQGSHSSLALLSQLRAAGSDLTQVRLHKLSPHPGLARPLPKHDVVYFVSPAGVRIYVENYGKAAFERETWCLGKATQQALAEQGVEAKIVRPG